MKWASVSCHDFLAFFEQRIRRLAILELSPILPFREHFLSECLEVHSPFITSSSCSQTWSLRDSTSPRWASLQFQSLSISLLLKFTNASVKRFHFVFLLHEFRSRFSKQMISVSVKKRFRNICRVRESDERFIAPKNLLMSQGKILSIGKCVLMQPILAIGS